VNHLKKNTITGATLVTLDEKEFKDLGITNKFHLQNLLQQRNSQKIIKSSTQKSTTSCIIGKENTWPEYLTMSGHPFMQQGWNSKYYKVGMDAQGYPIYQLSDYLLYGVYSIIGCTIHFDHTRQKWSFTRNCDTSPLKFKLGPQDTPFGSWPQAFAKPSKK